jgi:Fe-Mn family superoxide dismutase
MDSLAYMRLARDFGTFDDWQIDFVACALSARNGWAVTVYNCFLDRFMNVVIDLHNINIPLNCYPVIVLDMWEHAYFRDYLSDKQKYVFAMMKELNWEVIEDRVSRADKLARLFNKSSESK